jgi:hypothetical protein
MTLRAAFSGFRSHRVPRQPNRSHCLAQSISCRTRTVFVVRARVRRSAYAAHPRLDLQQRLQQSGPTLLGEHALP